MYLRLLLSSVFLLSLFACSTNRKQETTRRNKSLAGLSYNVTSEDTSETVSVHSVKIDTVYLHGRNRALRVSFMGKASQETFTRLRSNGYSSLFFNVAIENGRQPIYSSIKEIMTSKERLHVNKDAFFSRQGERTVEVVVPFRYLGLLEGNHTLDITIAAHPVAFREDSAGIETKVIDHVSEKAEASVSLQLTLFTPKLYKVAIEVEKFKVDKRKTDVNRYDFSLGGPGLPDIFWDLSCGGDFLYYSEPVKNALVYNKKTTSTPFYCTADDVIEISVADYDNGPFNTQHDVIGTWTGKLNDLPANKPDTLVFGNLEYFIVKTKAAE